MFKKYIAICVVSLFAVNSTLADEPKVAHNSAEWQIWAIPAAPDFIEILLPQKVLTVKC